jgi:hypothetical protein
MMTETGAKSTTRRLGDLRRETRSFTSPRTNALALGHLLSGCRTVLDIGCGRISPLRFVPGPETTGVDSYEPKLAAAEAARTHDRFRRGGIREIGYTVWGVGTGKRQGGGQPKEHGSSLFPVAVNGDFGQRWGHDT